MELLRVATAGSVDDGKSTLIGRLLFDTKSVLDDQFEALERTSRCRGDDYPDLALLVDGLRAEREQGITIDVAYRYFASTRRSFALADTPGHVQYTRNMVTGASTADVALILVDARTGILEQTRRHCIIADLLRVPHVLLCVNKMDLVGFDRRIFERIRDDFRGFAARLHVTDVSAIPVSALLGDNVVAHSPSTPWYEGGSLLHHLEEVHIAGDRNLIDARFPVQCVIRPQRGSGEHGRAYAGQVAGGVLRVNDEVVVLPGRHATRIASIDTFDGPRAEAFPPMSVSLRLVDELDVSRGDMLCRPGNQPRITRELEAMICWLSETAPLTPGSRYLLKHTTRTVRARVETVRYRMDVNSGHRQEDVTTLAFNDIGRVALHTTSPVFVDPYMRNRTTGAFVLIDAVTGATVAAGMVSP